MLRKLLRVSVIGASVLALAACGGQNNAGDMSQNGYRTNQTGAGQGIRGNATGYGNHNNRNLRINQDMARAIERIDGISRARVVMGESNAYVAVELNENAGNSPALGGSNARSSQSAQEYGIRGNYYGVTDSRAFPSVVGQDGTNRGAGAMGRNEVGSASSAPNMYGYNSRGPGRGLNGGAEISGYAGGEGDNGGNGGFLNGLGRMLGLNRGGNGANGGGNGAGAAGTAGAGTGNGLLGGLTTQRTNGASANGGKPDGATGLNDGARGYATNHRTDLNGNVDYGRYQGMNGNTGAAGNGDNGGVTGAGRSGRIGLNRTGMNEGSRDDANSRYMYNGGTYGQMNAYNNNNGLSMQVRARVESVVRSLAPNVRNVYVSADRNFMQRLGTYNAGTFNAKGNAGRNDPIAQFNDFVGRLFDADNDPNRYDMSTSGYDQRNRNGVTQLMDNSFERGNPRHTGLGGVSGAGTGMNQAQAGTLGSAR